jgi:hypothetical protein
VTVDIADAPMVEHLDDAAPLLHDPEALRRRAERDGYLYFRGLLPRDLVLGLRQQFVDILSEFGWLRAGTDPMDGVADREAVAEIDPDALAFCGVGIPREAYVAVQKLELFHAIAHLPQLISLYEMLFGEEVLVHPRHIARLMLPAPSFTPTPSHQDFTHVQGAKTFWTLWFPVGDVPLELGGLSVLSGSHYDGIYRYSANKGAGGLEAMICETDHEWHTAPMRAGDVLTFHSHTVHKSNPNRLPDLVRTSCDLRYQPASMEIEERSLKVHCDVATWDEVYEGWTNDRLKYYWRRNDLVFSEWDSSLVQTHRNIC